MRPMLLPKLKKHDYCENIAYILNSYGFGYIWNNAYNTQNNFHQTFTKRLQDSFRQYWNDKCESSSITKLLYNLKEDYNICPYLLNIKNPY